MGISHEALDRKSTTTDDRWLDRQKAIMESKSASQSVASEESWKNDRDALLLAIKNAKKEIRNLQKQDTHEENLLRKSPRASKTTSIDNLQKSQRGTTSAENLLQRSQEYTKSFLRKAITKELELIQNNTHPIVLAIKSEKEYKKSLKRDLEEVEQTKKTIEDFYTKMFGNSSNKDEEVDLDYANKKQRLDMLKAELADLQKQIGE